MNEVGELGRVSDEEDRGIVEHPVPVSLVSSQLDGESSRVTRSVRGTAFTSDSGEADCRTDLLANAREEGVGRDVAEVVRGLEIAMSSSAFSVDLI